MNTVPDVSYTPVNERGTLVSNPSMSGSAGLAIVTSCQLDLNETDVYQHVQRIRYSRQIIAYLNTPCLKAEAIILSEALDAPYLRGPLFSSPPRCSSCALGCA